MNATTDSLRFGGARLEQARRIVADVTGRETVLRAKSYDVLALLLSRPDAVVTKDELFEKIWNGVAVTEDALVQCITDIRKAIGERGHDALKTITKVGYRLVPDASAPQIVQTPQPTLRTIHPRGIAVLPFTNLGGGQEQDFLADGLAEDVITDLSRSADLFVIARNSSFSFKGKEQDHNHIASELGVRYLVEGSLRKSGERLRITARLIDTQSNGAQVWAERFDHELEDIFDVQDEVSRKTVEAISGRILSEYKIDKYRPASLEAYDLVVRSRYRSALSRASTFQAISDLKRALTLDPGYPEALRQLAHCQFRAWNTWGEPEGKYREVALQNVLQACSLEPASAIAHALAAYLLMYDGKFEDADQKFKKALWLNPGDPDALMFSLDYFIFRDLKQQAVDTGARAFRLNPYPPSSYYWVYGFALVANGQYEQAVDVLRHEATYRTASQRILAAALALLGRGAEAREESSSFMESNPTWRISAWIATQPFENKSDAPFWRKAYLLAGLPE
jgi:TolB-like protein